MLLLWGAIEHCLSGPLRVLPYSGMRVIRVPLPFSFRGLAAPRDFYIKMMAIDTKQFEPVL